MQPVTFSRFDWGIYVCTLEATVHTVTVSRFCTVDVFDPLSCLLYYPSHLRQLKLLHVSKRNREFHRNGKSQKEQVLLLTLQSTEINTNLKGTDMRCTVGTEMCACTKEMSVFRFTQTEVNKSHPK